MHLRIKQTFVSCSNTKEHQTESTCRISFGVKSRQSFRTGELTIKETISSLVTLNDKSQSVISAIIKRNLKTLL